MKRYIVIIDNFDSFTFNLKNLFESITSSLYQIKVLNHKTTTQEVRDLNPYFLILGPGPGGPQDAGVTLKLISYFSGRIPILGVCLGMQCLNYFYGGHVLKASIPIHGKMTPLKNFKKHFFSSLPSIFFVARYHSLRVIPAPNFEILAESDDLPMVIYDQEKQLIGLQFHPESFMSEYGEEMMTLILKHFGLL